MGVFFGGAFLATVLTATDFLAAGVPLFLAAAFFVTAFFAGAAFFAAAAFFAGAAFFALAAFFAGASSLPTAFVFGDSAALTAPAIRNFVRSLAPASHAGARPRPLHVAPVLGSR